ncbi:MAG: 50S ribosomal protein L24 [Sphingobacteriales bacterium]|nr:50S ribosomal protein L24 [Sphingobacteriales bacterium]
MKNEAKKTFKFHIKKGDTVKVISGDDKGKTGIVLHVNRDTYRAIVEGLNMVTKHQKPTAANTAGSRVQLEAPIHISNLMLVDANGVAGRVGRKVVDGKKVRYSKKSGEVIINQ